MYGSSVGALSGCKYMVKTPPALGVGAGGAAAGGAAAG